MPRRTFAPEGDWSIDLPEVFEAHTPSTWEVWEEPRFVTPDQAVWAEFFEYDHSSPEEAVEEHLSWTEVSESVAEYRLDDAESGLVGRSDRRASSLPCLPTRLAPAAFCTPGEWVMPLLAGASLVSQRDPA